MDVAGIWQPYLENDFQGSLQLTINTLAEHGAIDLLHIAGLSLMQLHRHDEGIQFLKTAVLFRPQASHIYSNAAYMAEQTGRLDDLEFFVNTGLQDHPDDPALLLLKANGHVMKLRFTEAESIYRQLLSLDPRHIQALVNLGNIARAHDRFADAESYFAQADQIDPTFRDVRFARATMYTQMGRNVEAIQLLETMPDDTDAKFLLSLHYLADGDYERGLDLHRSRSQSIWYRQGNFVRPLRPFDHWLEAAGRSVAVVQEGGLGDAIQFCRYIPLLASVATHVTLFLAPTLHRLLQLNMPDNVTIQSNVLTDESGFDYVTTDVELPYHFRTTLDTIPSGDSYLGNVRRARLIKPNHQVGVCWSGGKQDHLNQRSYDERRSIALDEFMPIIETIAKLGYSPVCLQHGFSHVGLEGLFASSIDGDMLDTAELIASLDLVITVDTSVVHLAAALGKPVWLLSRYDACWRWLHNRPDSPWYPSVRVFGQQSYRDWSVPIKSVIGELESWEAPA